MPSPVIATPATDRDLEFAKWFALLAMLANHIALTMPMPWRDAGILIGRVCLPLFSVLIVIRLQHDPERRATRYLSRLLIWGLVAQPIYLLLLSSWPLGRLNALFTLEIGVSLIYLAQVLGIGVSAAVAGVVVLGTHWLDGGAWMPVAQLLAWYLLRRRADQIWQAVGIVTLFAVGMNVQSSDLSLTRSLLVMIAVPLILATSHRLSKCLPRLPKVVFYGFYPVHLAIIYAINGPYTG